MSELRTLLQRLADGRVDFVLIGGYAAVVHGVTLVTQDVDICCPLNRANLSRLQRVLADLHPRHRMLPDRPALEMTEELATGLRNLYLETDLGPLDRLSEVAGGGGFDQVLRVQSRSLFRGERSESWAWMD